MNTELIKEELDRAFEVLGKERGELQNDTDLYIWAKKGLITIEQYKDLLVYNRNYK